MYVFLVHLNRKNDPAINAFPFPDVQTIWRDMNEQVG